MGESQGHLAGKSGKHLSQFGRVWVKNLESREITGHWLVASWLGAEGRPGASRKIPPVRKTYTLVKYLPRVATLRSVFQLRN